MDFKRDIYKRLLKWKNDYTGKVLEHKSVELCDGDKCLSKTIYKLYEVLYLESIMEGSVF